MDSTRKAFEEWISGPPCEREVERFGDGSAWPGSYREIDVDLAWLAWIAAVAATRADERERCAKKLEARIMGDNNREDAEVRRCIDAIRKG